MIYTKLFCMLFIFSTPWLLIIEKVSCEVSDCKKSFLRALRLMQFSKNKNVDRPSEIENKCDIWEALHLYLKRELNNSNLKDQSKVLLEQISKKARVVESFKSNSKLGMIEDLSNLALKQMAILDLVEREKGILENAAHTINGIINNTISIYKISVKEGSIYNIHGDDSDAKKYSILSDKHYNLTFRSEAASSDYVEGSVGDGNLEYSMRKNGKDPGINKSDLDYNRKSNTSSILNWRRIFKRDPGAHKEIYYGKNDEIKELYELVESLVYGTGKLKLLFGAFEWIDENAQGVFSRISWNLNEELNKIMQAKNNS